jgi:prevent-host-death family protein
MATYNIHAAKTQFSKLVQLAEAGEEIIIARDGQPAAKLVPYAMPKLEPRQPGGWEGKVWYAPDYDQADKEIEKLFYGEDTDEEEVAHVAESESEFGKQP